MQQENSRREKPVAEKRMRLTSDATIIEATKKYNSVHKHCRASGTDSARASTRNAVCTGKPT